MPALWKLIKNPFFWLAIILLTCVLDNFRFPENQILAKVYIKGVKFYQNFSHTETFSGYVKCRYVPSCSYYSINAVEKYGLWKGMYLSLKRIASCTRDVKMGMVDNVP